MTIQVPESQTPALLVMKGAFMRKLVLLMVLTLRATAARPSMNNSPFRNTSGAKIASLSVFLNF